MSKTKNAMALFTRGAQMLAEATTIQQNKELKDLGITAADWVRRKGMGEKAVTQARAFAFDAERQMGKLLEKSERAKGGAQPGVGRRGKQCGNQGVPHCEQSTLEELGLKKKESSAAQKLASLPKRVYQKVRSGLITRTEAFRQLRRAKIEHKLAAMPEKKYRVIYADPPWKYGEPLA